MQLIDPRDFVRLMRPQMERVASFARERQPHATAWGKDGGQQTVEHEEGHAVRVGTVSDVDMGIQELLLGFVLKRWPFVRVLAEEETETRKAFGEDGEYCVLLDPIDGTKPFLRGESGFCHIVSLMRGPEMCASLVYSHVKRELFAAVSGQGAERSPCGQPPARTYLAEQTDRQIVLRHVSRIPDALVTALSAAGYEVLVSEQNATDILGMIDDGSVRGFISREPVTYDVWSPGMVVQEAGGWIGDWRGSPLRFSGQERIPSVLVAASAQVAADVLPLLRARA